VITSLLDTDLYKFTMWQAMLHRHPQAVGEYEFVCRNAPAYPLAELLDEVNGALDALCTLRFREDELDYLGGLRYIKADFVDFLRLFQFQRRFIGAWAEGGQLHIRAAGPQVHVTLFEIPVLAIVNELYFRRFDTAKAIATGRERLQVKITQLEPVARGTGRRFPFDVSDFGTRRRFSADWQREVVTRLRDALPEIFKGTSNVRLARELALTPIGTMAHEYLQTFQGLGVRLRDFDMYFCKLFDGARHDSGDPFDWGERMLAHYRKLRIEPATKRLVFSDALTVPKALAIYDAFADRCPTGFGIGTNLTNDMGLEPLNIVMKLVAVNGQPVAKISDTPGKTLVQDATFLAYLKQVFGVK
jgi:nicotinate phosphoribosyltransferase